MKTEYTFHRQIYICSGLCKRYYYSFIHRHQFENFVFVMLAQTDAQYSSSSFFIAQLSCWKTHFSLSGKLENIFLLCWLIGKITSHLPGQVGALGQAWACVD